MTSIVGLSFAIYPIVIKPSKAIFFFLAGLLLVACAPLNAVRVQQEKTLRVDVDNTVLFASALDFVGLQGWEVESSDQGLGWIEALGPVDDSEGMTTRERWRISTSDGEIGIQLALEVLERGKWSSVNLVCHTYSYARETQHLSTLANIAKNRSHQRAGDGTLAATPTPTATATHSRGRVAVHNIAGVHRNINN